MFYLTSLIDPLLILNRADVLNTFRPDPKSGAATIRIGKRDRVIVCDTGGCKFTYRRDLSR